MIGNKDKGKESGGVFFFQGGDVFSFDSDGFSG